MLLPLIACLAVSTLIQDDPNLDALDAEPVQPSPAELLDEVDIALAAEDVDGALAVLWLAPMALPLAEPAQRQELATRIDALTTAHDPHAELLLKELDGTATRLNTTAKLYQKAAWFDTCFELLDAAERFQPGSSSKVRDAADKDFAKRPKVEVPTQAPPKTTPLLHTFVDVNTFGDWRKTESGWECPADDQGGIMHAGKPQHADCRLTVDVRVGSDGVSQAGLVFGSRSWQDAFILIVNAGTGQAGFDLELLQITSETDSEVKAIGTKGYPMDKLVRPWTTLVVEVRGKQLRAGIQGGDFFEIEAPHVPHGGVGLFVTSTSTFTDTVGFRNMTISELDAEAEPPPAKPTPQEVVQSHIDAADVLIQAKSLEAATRELLLARALLCTIESSATRTSYHMAVDSRWRSHDKSQKKHASNRRKTAVRLTILARAYLDSGLPFTAKVVLDEALRFDPEVPYEAWIQARDKNNE